jgi:glutathione S-transferase
MITFYYTPDTCSLASHLALEQADARYELVKIDFARNQQRSPEYLKVNPKGRVPALITERGVLTETPALLEFIAQTHPKAGLAPFDDPFALAQMNAFNSYLCSTVHVAHSHRMRGARWADDPAAWEAMKKKAPQAVADGFALIESDYLRGPWVLGERFSTSDFYLLTLARWLEDDGVDTARLPRVLDHRRRMLELPLVRRVIVQEEGHPRR